MLPWKHKNYNILTVPDRDRLVFVATSCSEDALLLVCVRTEDSGNMKSCVLELAAIF